MTVEMTDEKKAVTGEKKVVSEVQMMRDYEVAQAAKMRGGCNSCGHRWRPRNPSTAVNRCPGCGVRNQVSYQHLDPKVVVELT